MESLDPSATNDSGFAESSSVQSLTTTPYSTGRTRAKVVLVLYGFGILLAICLAALDLWQFQQMRLLAGGKVASEADVENIINQSFYLDLTWVIWYVTTIVAFLMWIHRAYRNLSALGAEDLEFSPRGAVGWYFVPFLNLFRPYQVMREIYNASDPNLPERHGATERGRSAPNSIKLWWGLFLLMGFVGRAASIAYNDTIDPTALQLAYGVFLVAHLTAIVAIVAAMWVVSTIDLREETRATAYTFG